jgi:hypothetical protein
VIGSQEFDMPDRMQYDERDPRHHTQKLKQILNDTAVHAQEDHIKQVPGRKTDQKDSEWIADLLQHGLLRGSCVPPLGRWL